jgi:hypothetical protein
MEPRSRELFVHEYSNNMPGAQEATMFQQFGKIVASRKLDPHWPAIALQTQQLLDAFLTSAAHHGALVDVS